MSAVPRLALIVLTLLSPAPTAAHGPDILLAAEPRNGAVVTTPPSQITVRFRVELDAARSRLQVLDSEGRPVDRGRGGVDLDDPDHASLRVGLQPVPDGRYTVRWRAVVLEDGDVVDGTLAFTVARRR